MEIRCHVPTNIIFKNHAVSQIFEQRLHGKNALIVCSQASAKRFGYLNLLTNKLKKSFVSYVVYDRISHPPTKSHIMAAAELARLEKCDFVIGLGGGSVLDAAKVVAMLYKNGGDLWDYAKYGTGKNLTPKFGALPIVLVSSGTPTGTEVNCRATILKEATKEKAVFNHECLYAATTIIDPAFLYSLNSQQITSLGMTAAIRTMMSMMSKKANMLSDLYAAKASELLQANLTSLIEQKNTLSPLSLQDKNVFDLVWRDEKPINLEELDSQDGISSLALACLFSALAANITGDTSLQALTLALSSYHDISYSDALTFLFEDYFNYLKNGAPALPNQSAASKLSQFIPNSQTIRSLAKTRSLFDFILQIKDTYLKKPFDFKSYGMTKSMILNYTKNALDVHRDLFKNDCHSFDYKDIMRIYNASFLREMAKEKVA